MPELRDAELTLESTLAEACAADPASNADTNELIRLDELLEAASDAAKRAVSLRRRRRADKAKSERSEMGAVEAQLTGDATHRIFVDTRGMRWDVFAVHPEARPSVHSQLKGTYSAGWLCFDSASEKRRLSPIPEEWQLLTNVQLAELAERAEIASGRRGRDSGKEEAEDSPRSE